MTSYIYIPKLHNYNYIYKSYANHKLSICPMLLVTAIMISTRPNILTFLLEYNGMNVNVNAYVDDFSEPINL